MTDQAQNYPTRNGLYGFEYLAPDKRRIKEGEDKSWEVTQLWQRSHEIINLHALGYKNTEIAQILNITPQTVSNTVNGKLGQHKVSEIRQERDQEVKILHEKIRVLTNKALDVYHQIFDDESGNITLKDKKVVADTVALDIGGLRAPTKIQSQSVHTILSKDDLEAFKSRGSQVIESLKVTNQDVINIESEAVRDESED